MISVYHTQTLTYYWMIGYFAIVLLHGQYPIAKDQPVYLKVPYEI